MKLVGFGLLNKLIYLAIERNLPFFEARDSRRNAVGTGGKLAKTYAALLEELWSGKYSAVAPNAFKKALSQIAPQFRYGHELLWHS